MNTHKKLIEQLSYAARIAELNAPSIKTKSIQRVRVDLSVAEVHALEAEARALNRKVNELEKHVNTFQSAHDTLEGPIWSPAHD